MAGALKTLSTAVDDDLSRLTDERLVFLVQARDSIPARDLLTKRHLAWVGNMVSRLGAQRNLSDEDRDDAHQDAVLWIFEAIDQFDTGQIDRSHRCCFRSFVYRVVTMRFRDFFRRLARLDRYKRQLPQVTYKTDVGRRHLAVQLARDAHHEKSDVISSAERHEMALRLHAVLQQLDGGMREMGELLTAGVALREIATRQRISYDAAKRRRRKMLEHLRYCLSE